MQTRLLLGERDEHFLPVDVSDYCPLELHWSLDLYCHEWLENDRFSCPIALHDTKGETKCWYLLSWDIPSLSKAVLRTH